MIVVWDSRTGNVERFVNKLEGIEKVKIHNDIIVDEPFVLITYTTGMGKVPQSTLDFLEHNHQHMLGVACSGNRNWGDSYARAADIISQKYNVPILLRFELSGLSSDVNSLMERLRQFEAH
ncbi:class Ib ribonucleoside-diphosphate reductase assembly flavoprotein NrdI [Paenibacillus cremeus]|uniref:Protein NrdI n=1 Tax=Paenibacillus cremeus TaxID=2163881 RepID=A0A559KCZ3_9BACL|nr:class Ib ribonucleoside-diphosphate reductase assembly flavoprotein NrdI [Paenibacillus cremeus]TVY10001.1 class Ib ribonucleoside-diphosphate reductase assembly flavoprotein NrdI [Paenibacillus cremeus]